MTSPSPEVVPARRATAEERAQRNPLVRMVTAVTTGTKQFMDDRRMNRLLKAADRQARRDAFASDPNARESRRRTYYSGVSKESLAAQSVAGRAALVEAIEAAQRGQAGGAAQGQPLDAQSAVDLMREGQPHPGAPAPEGHSTGQGGAAVSPIEKGKGKEGGIGK
jgi:hypothetical protein